MTDWRLHASITFTEEFPGLPTLDGTCWCALSAGILLIWLLAVISDEIQQSHRRTYAGELTPEMDQKCSRQNGRGREHRLQYAPWCVLAQLDCQPRLASGHVIFKSDYIVLLLLLLLLLVGDVGASSRSPSCNDATGMQVGVLTMAGRKPTILVTPTADLGKVLNSMASLQIEGEANFCASSQIAQLALKHRENKNQRQRIVMFVGSPLVETKVRSPPCCLTLPIKQPAEGV